MNIDKVIQEENYEKYCEKKSKKEKNKDVFKKNKKSTKSCIRISLEKETIKNQQKEIITKKETFNDDKVIIFY